MATRQKQNGGSSNTVIYIILGVVGVVVLMQLMKPSSPPPGGIQIDPVTGQPMSTTAQDISAWGSLGTGFGNLFSGLGDFMGSILGNRKKTGDNTPPDNPYGVTPGTMASGGTGG